jgi:hypothetical protein
VLRFSPKLPSKLKKQFAHARSSSALAFAEIAKKQMDAQDRADKRDEKKRMKIRGWEKTTR